MIAKRLAGLACAVALGGSLLTGTVTAQAAPESSGRHCAYEADSGKTTCFATFTELTGYLTGGRVTNAPAEPTAEAVQELTAQATGSPIHAVLYQSTGYTGTTYTLSSSGGCGTYHWTNLSDFNNKVSSAWVDAGCAIRLWDGSNLTSSSYGYYEMYSADNIPLWFNDKASSVEFW